MDTLNLIFIGLSAVATFGLLMCTIFGFIFINKQTKILDSQLRLSNEQIKIAKNKEIVLIIQKSLENEMNEYIKRDFDILDSLELFVKDVFFDPKHNNTIGLKNYHAVVEYYKKNEGNSVQARYQTLYKKLKTFLPNELFALYYWALNDEEINELEKIRKRIYDTDIMEKLGDLKSLENVIKYDKIYREKFKNQFYKFAQDRTFQLAKEAENLIKFISAIAKNRGIS